MTLSDLKAQFSQVLPLASGDKMSRVTDSCLDKYEHIWTIKVARGHDEVYCARCQQCMPVERMLHAYVELYGGEVRRG